ncbi:MAG: SagB/ThcOx family dehydrogenase [Sedimentisphaerales bacterium]|nr:SagB/ThcOx family dehydrogenase [Sedimentisphaerales bacterium]
MSGIGDQFQSQTKYHRDHMLKGRLDFASQPELYKSYPDVEIVDLPFVTDPGGLGMYDTLRKRRSVRRFSDSFITADQLVWLLWASTGITRTEGGWAFRAAPSAGALYPIETYLCVNRVEDIESGLYHYSIPNHKLETLSKGAFGAQISAAALDQDMCVHAAVVFVWSAVFARSKWKYKQRAYRYVYMDAGHIAANLALAATNVGLAGCHIAALYDDQANALFGLDGTSESIIYMTVIGKPA